MGTAIKEIKKINQIEENEFEHITKFLFQSFLVKSRSKNSIILEKQEVLLDSFTDFLNKYLELNYTNSKKSKLELINFIDKLNMQRELLEVQKENIDMAEIKTAAKHLGRKSQSAFHLK